MLAFLMMARAGEQDLKGSTLWTSKEYKDFILQLDFLYNPGSVDSGVFIHERIGADPDRHFQISETGYADLF
jgi:hypothetical protein